MANIKDKMLYFVGNKLLKYVYKNPQKNMLKLIKIGKAVAGKMYPESTFTKPIEIISDPTNVWHKYLFDGLRDIDPDFFCSAALTFAIDLGLNGTKTIRKRREQEHYPLGNSYGPDFCLQFEMQGLLGCRIRL